MEVMEGVNFLDEDEIIINGLFDAVSKEQSKAREALDIQRKIDDYINATGDDSEEVYDAIEAIIFDANDPLFDGYYVSITAFNGLYEAWKEAYDKATYARVFGIFYGGSLTEYLRECLERLTSEEQIKNRELVKNVYEKYIKKEN